MRSTLTGGLMACLIAGAARADESSLHMVIGANEYLVAGVEAIIAGSHDEGIRLTKAGLEQVVAPRDRAAGLANLCAAYVAKGDPDSALPYCSDALRIDANNWRVYTTRSRAYLLKDMLAEAVRDNEAAFAINPSSAHVRMMRAMLNERTLQPHVIIEDHH